MVKLPKSLEQNNTLSNVKVGKPVWTVPWAMVVAADRTCWLNLQHTYTLRRAGTSNLRVECTIYGTFIVDTTQTDFRWTVDERSSVELGEHIAPVVEIRS